MKRTLILSSLFTSFIFTAVATQAAEPTNKTSKIIQTKTEAADKISAQNKKIVTDFYEGVFLKHQVKNMPTVILVMKYTT